MKTENDATKSRVSIGSALPVIVVAGLGLAGWVLVHACGSELGCVEGARTLWHEWLPPRVRSQLRMSFMLVTLPLFYVVLAGLLVFERWRRARADQAVFSPGFVHDFVAWFLLDKLAFGFLFATLFGYSLIHSWWMEHMQWATIDLTPLLPQWALLAISFVFADFLNWFHHLVRHKVPLLWMFHAVHHGDREMNTFTDDRVHPVEKLVASGIMLFPQLILRIDLPWTFGMLLFQQIYTHIYHANLRTDYGPLRYLLVTPQSHRVHHSQEPAHIDCNFGVVFSIWDRIFGTHVSATGEYPQTGVEDPGLPNATRISLDHILATYVAQFVYPFRQIWWRLTLGTWYPQAAASHASSTRQDASAPLS